MLNLCGHWCCDVISWHEDLFIRAAWWASQTFEIQIPWWFVDPDAVESTCFFFSLTHCLEWRRSSCFRTQKYIVSHQKSTGKLLYLHLRVSCLKWWPRTYMDERIKGSRIHFTAFAALLIYRIERLLSFSFCFCIFPFSNDFPDNYSITI